MQLTDLSMGAGRNRASRSTSAEVFLDDFSPQAVEELLDSLWLSYRDSNNNPGEKIPLRLLHLR